MLSWSEVTADGRSGPEQLWRCGEFEAPRGQGEVPSTPRKKRTKQCGEVLEWEERRASLKCTIDGEELFVRETWERVETRVKGHSVCLGCKADMSECV